MPISQIDAMTNTEFRASVKARYPQAELFESRYPHACTILCLQENRCRLLYNGEATPDQIDDVFAQAVKAGHTKVGYGLLVDFTHFFGTIDWDFAKRRKSITPGMEPQPRKIAYVMRDAFALLAAEAITLWLPQFECQVFQDIGKAEAWLGWD